MRQIIPFVLFILLSNISFGQLQPIKKLVTDRKTENPVTFATTFNNKYLYNKLTFAVNGVATNELWITDGTETGTILLTNAPGNFSAGGTVNNQFIFFKAAYGTNGDTLVYDCWKTDGTIPGTTIIKPGVASGTNDGSSYTRRPRNFTLVDNQLFFVTNGGTSRQQLWKVNANTVDTVKTDFAGLDYFTGLFDLVSFNNQLYFLIKSPGNVNDSATLWKSDGFYTGTVPVLSSTAQSFRQPDFAGSVQYNGKLIFSASDNIHGNELWITDGTASGTRLLFDAVRGNGSSYPLILSLLKDKLFFFENYGYLLTVYDLNTNSRTVLGSGYQPVINSAMTVNNKLLFKSVDARRGLEWFVTDGTVSGTSQLADTRKGVAGAFDYGETDVSTSAPGGNFYFTANDGIHGNELWTSDMTGPNTRLFADIAPGAAWSSPKYLKIADGKLFFVAYDKTDWHVYAVPLANAPPAASSYVPFKTGEWMQTFGAKNYVASGYFNYLEGLATDSKTNVYLSGRFLSPDNDFVFFDSDTIAKGNSLYLNYTYKDYLIKLGPDGKFKWYKNNGGSDFFANNAIAVDKNDEVVAAGGATAPVVFDNIVLDSRQGVYLAKYDTAGNTKWFKVFNSGQYSNIQHVAIDGNNNIIVGGVYKNNFIDMGNGVSATSLYDGQYFVAKTSTDGAAAWVANIPVYVGYLGYIKKIISDGSANVYVLTTLFGPNTIANGCITDTTYIQITKLNSTGKILWNKKFDGVGVINAMSLTADAAGLLNVTGYYSGKAFIDKYSLNSGFNANCTKNEIIQVQIKISDGTVTGVGRFENASTNIIDIKPNADGTYYVLGYKINSVQQPKQIGFENAPYSSPTRQLVLEHRFYTGKLIDSKAWNVGAETIFTRSYFTTNAQNDFIIATCGAQYIDTFANGIANYNMNISAWKSINQFSTPVVSAISSLSTVNVLNNPASDRLILSLSGTGITGQANVYNSVGQLVLQQQINGSLFIITIGVSSLGSGVYFISVPVASGRQTIKFVKL